MSHRFLIAIFIAVLVAIATSQTAPASDVPSLFPSPIPSPRPSARPTPRPSSRKPSLKPIHIYGEEKHVSLSAAEQKVVVGVLTISLFILMACEFLTPEVLFLIALMIVTFCQIITLAQCFAGFANNALVTIGALFLVIGGVEKSHVVDYMARKTFGQEGSVLIGKARMFMTSFALSIFFNNTPLVAILIPVVKDWARMRNVAASQVLMPLSYSVLAGSFVTMIGTSTNLTVQGLMQISRGYSFGFFAPAPIGCPLFFLLLIYQLIFGPIMLPNTSGLIREVMNKPEFLIAEVVVGKDSPSAGKSVSHMMNSLGLAPSGALKIRRKKEVVNVNDEVATKTVSIKERFSSLANDLRDPTFLKRSSGFWSIPKPVLSDNGAYELTSMVSDEEEGNSQFEDIISPDFHEIVLADDVVYISHAKDVVEKMIKSIAGENKGLSMLHSNASDLPGYGTEIVELVISDSNPFQGRKVVSFIKEFSEKYDVGLITVRGKSWAFAESEEPDVVVESSGPPSIEGATDRDEVENGGAGNEPNEKKTVDMDPSTDVKTEFTKADEIQIAIKDSISNHVLEYGDVVLCVTNDKNLSRLEKNKDFFVVSTVGKLPMPLTIYSFAPMVIFVLMLVLAALETVDIAAGSMCAAAFFFIGGWIKGEEIPELIDLRLLMLIGTSLSFATSMTSSGLAVDIAETINKSNPTPFAALLLIYVITLVITELISNNAAAALMYPIAVALADQLGVSYKTFAMSVLIASTAGFMSPIGYQTHLMVWAPGGYRFKDFLIFGVIPDLMYWFVGCALIIASIPFDTPN